MSLVNKALKNIENKEQKSATKVQEAFEDLLQKDIKQFERQYGYNSWLMQFKDLIAKLLISLTRKKNLKAGSWRLRFFDWGHPVVSQGSIHVLRKKLQKEVKVTSFK